MLARFVNTDGKDHGAVGVLQRQLAESRMRGNGRPTVGGAHEAPAAIYAPKVCARALPVTCMVVLLVYVVSKKKYY